MCASGKPAQHAGRILLNHWLTENLIVHYHDRIGPQNQILRKLFRYSLRFFLRQAQRVWLRAFVPQRRFVNLGRWLLFLGWIAGRRWCRREPSKL